MKRINKDKIVIKIDGVASTNTLFKNQTKLVSPIDSSMNRDLNWSVFVPVLLRMESLMQGRLELELL